MPIGLIREIANKKYIPGKPIKEKANIFIPDIDPELNIPNRNGFHCVMTGSGGSGKSSLMLSLIKGPYKKKFNNIYYICPMVSFLSVASHPFKNHDKVYHELTIDLLLGIYKELEEKKEEEDDIEYSLIIIDDMADALKDADIQRVLNKMMIKSRHLGLSWIITLQAFIYFPKILRRQITNLILFKPKSVDEFNIVSKEMFNMKEVDNLKIHNYVFDAPYTHLDVDTVENNYFKNFNKLIFNLT